MEAGLTDEANVTFLRVLEQLGEIEKNVAEQAESQAAAETKRAGNENLHVLLVEDDADQRELLAGVLAMQGCRVSTANDGDQALDYLENNQWPDYVLLDMRMPQRDGVSTVRRLREINASPNLRILATSGTSPEDLGIGFGSVSESL